MGVCKCRIGFLKSKSNVFRPERKQHWLVPTCSEAGLAEESVHIDASIGALVRHAGTEPAVEQVTRCIQRLINREILIQKIY